MADEPNTTSTKLPSSKPTAEKGWMDVSPFHRLRHEIDRVFEDFGGAFRGFPSRMAMPDLGPGWAAFSQKLAPAVDIVERGDHYEITAELPGLDEKDIEVKLTGGMLTLRGEKKSEREEEKGDMHVSERRYGSFQRSFSVPDNVDQSRIEAHFDKGVLKVNLPKSAAKPEKKIEIRKP